MKYLLILLILHFLHSTDAADTSEQTARKRRFSIFSVVQFQNTLCTIPLTSTSTATAMKGTCYTTSECSSNGGVGSGNCASGFGVCCMITVSTCGLTITKNTTYIQNPGFPSGFQTITTPCTYTIATTSDICQIRLDFDNAVLGNPPLANVGAVGALTATTGACTATDQLKIVSSSGGATPNASPPIVCGVLTGQHMYIETGRQSPTGATLSFTSGAVTNPPRTWKIRVTLIECGNVARAPTDCLQYYTGPSGTFSSFNYQNGVAATGQLLQAQNYNICFRQEEGYCSNQISETDVTLPAKSFALQNPAVAAAIATSLQNNGALAANCMFAEITITSNNPTVNTNAFCGSYLNEVAGNNLPGSITTSSLPFTVGVFTQATTIAAGSNAALMNAVGFNLNYNQVPC